MNLAETCCIYRMSHGNLTIFEIIAPQNSSGSHYSLCTNISNVIHCTLSVFKELGVSAWGWCCSAETCRSINKLYDYEYYMCIWSLLMQQIDGSAPSDLKKHGNFFRYLVYSCSAWHVRLCSLLELAACSVLCRWVRDQSDKIIGPSDVRTSTIPVTSCLLLNSHPDSVQHRSLCLRVPQSIVRGSAKM